MFGLKKKESKIEKIDEQKLPPNVMSKKVHVSGYIFKENENLISENRVLSPNGDGWLLITNIGMFFILDSAGIYLNLKHEMIDSFVTENDNKVSIHWNEESGSFDYQFRIKNGEQEAKRIVVLANEAFHYKRSSVQQIELSKSEVEQTKKKYIDRFQKLIEISQIKEKELESKLIMIKNEDLDKQKKKMEILSEITKIRENLRAYDKNIEYIDKMHITRSYKIPENIPVGNVWNDCYFDESRNAFVTFRKKLIEESKKKPREIQRQFEEEMGTNCGVIIPSERITFRFGYPVIANTNQDGKHVWSILCTLTDDMLSEEIVLARLRSRKDKTDDESAIYDTVSEQWLGGDLKMCEKEYEIGHKNNIWRCTESLPEKIKWQKQLNASISND